MVHDGAKVHFLLCVSSDAAKQFTVGVIFTMYYYSIALGNSDDGK